MTRTIAIAFVLLTSACVGPLDGIDATADGVPTDADAVDASLVPDAGVDATLVDVPAVDATVADIGVDARSCVPPVRADVPQVPPYCTDADCDGYPASGCTGLDGAPFPSIDCNDLDTAVYPGAPETACDGVDRSCRGGLFGGPLLNGYCAATYTGPALGAHDLAPLCWVPPFSAPPPGMPYVNAPERECEACILDGDAGYVCTCWRTAGDTHPCTM